MKKRMVSALLAGMLAMVAITGCGNSSNETENANANAQTNQEADVEANAEENVSEGTETGVPKICISVYRRRNELSTGSAYQLLCKCIIAGGSQNSYC